MYQSYAGRHGESAETARAVVRMFPELPHGYRQLSSALARAGDLAGAVGAARTALGVAPDDAVTSELLRSLEAEVAAAEGDLA